MDDESVEVNEPTYRMIYESAREGLWVVDAEGRTLVVNARMAEMLGYDCDEMVGLPASRFLPETLGATMPARMEQLRGEKGYQDELLLRHRDGTAVWALVENSPLFGGDGALIGGVGLVTDITAGKGAEAEVKLRARLLGAVGEAVIATDMAGTITYWNGEAERLYGWAAGEVLGRSLVEVVAFEAGRGEAGGIGAGFMAGQPESGEFTARHRDGSQLLVAASFTAVVDADGVPVSSIWVSSDVTGRYEFRNGTDRLVALLDASPDSAAIADRTGRLLYLNRAGRAMAGIGPEEELTGHGVYDLHPPGWAETLRSTVFPTAAREGLWRGGSILVDGAAHQRVVDQIVVAHRGGDGVVEFYSSMARDITELKHVEELAAARDAALEVSKQARRWAEQQAVVATLGSQALAGTDLAVLVDDAVGAVAAGLEIQSAAMFDVAAGEELITRAAIGGLATVVGTGLVPAGVGGHLRYTLAVDEVVVVEDLSTESRFEPPAPLVAQGLVSGLSAIVTVTGRSYGVLAAYSRHRRQFSAEDVDFVQTVANLLGLAIERRRYEDISERLHSQERLAAVGQLAAGVAHDFNNIVAAISLYAELLEGQASLDDSGRAYVGAIRQQVERGAALVWQVLDFAQRSALEFSDVDLASFLEQLVPLLRRTVGEAVRLRVEHDGQPYLVRADTTRLQQIFMNLVSNADHAIDGPGEVNITLLRHGVDADGASPLDNPLRRPSVSLNIADTGAGMAADVLARAFEPFFTTKSPGQGTGLGLAQVHGLVVQHDGHIDAASHPGQGTRIRIWLPAAANTSLAPTVKRGEIHRGQGQTILVVDDDPAVRAAMASVLNWLGYTATATDSGEAACPILTDQSASISAIVCDIMMPGMGGHALAQVVADRWPQIPVILVSGYPIPTPPNTTPGPRGTDESHRGPVPRLQKPFSSRQLAEALGTALRDS